MSWGKLLHNVRSMELRPSWLPPINDELIHLARGARSRAPPAWQCWPRRAGPRRRQAVRTRLKPIWKLAERNRAMRARIGQMPNVALNGRFSKSTTISRASPSLASYWSLGGPRWPSKLRWAKRLSVGVADDETFIEFVDGPGHREIAGRHQRAELTAPVVTKE